MKKRLTFRAAVLGLLYLLLLATVIGGATAVVVMIARAVTDMIVLRLVIVCMAMPFVAYLFPLVSAPMTGIPAPKLRVFLLRLLPRGNARKRKAPNHTVDTDARKSDARGSP